MTKKKYGRGGRVWSATQTRGECGLTNEPITQGDQCLFLTCSGVQAHPDHQIKAVGEETYKWRGQNKTRVIRETPDGRRFRSVPTGVFRCKRNSCATEYDYYRAWCSCRAKVTPIYKWQEKQGEGWHDVTVWEKAVHAEAAVNLGYYVPLRSDGAFVTTVAHEGTRTVGHAHKVDVSAESPLVALGRVVTEGEIEDGPIDDPGILRFRNLDLD